MRKSATADLRVRDASLRDAPHHEAEQAKRCKQQRKYNACSRTNPCGERLADAPSPDRDVIDRLRNKKRPHGFRRAQFELWIFSYTILARLAKNKLSRVF
jgi:hypothetical protein